MWLHTSLLHIGIPLTEEAIASDSVVSRPIGDRVGSFAPPVIRIAQTCEHFHVSKFIPGTRQALVKPFGYRVIRVAGIDRLASDPS